MRTCLENTENPLRVRSAVDIYIFREHFVLDQQATVNSVPWVENHRLPAGEEGIPCEVFNTFSYSQP